jgi:branched-chain amino acid transport system ATP-binding protein
MSAILEIRALSKNFGGVAAVHDVTLDIPRGVVFALIGPNGAGKSTVVNLLTGALLPSKGTATLGGARVTGRKPHQVTAAGMARTFQSGRLFRRLSVLDNVLVGATPRARAGFHDIVARTPRFRASERQLAERAREALARLGLADLADREVGALPYGQGRMVEIARALVSDPVMLLLDEPAAGLNSGEVERFLGIVEALRRDGLTMLLIEHNMGLVMRVADRIAVLNFGEIIAEGTPAEVRANPAVLEAYLGAGTAHA